MQPALRCTYETVQDVNAGVSSGGGYALLARSCMVHDGVGVVGADDAARLALHLQGGEVGVKQQQS